MREIIPATQDDATERADIARSLERVQQDQHAFLTYQDALSRMFA